MKYLRLSLFAVLCSFYGFNFSYSQKLDSIQKLDEVSIYGPRLRYYSTGNQYITIDSVSKSLYQSSNLKSILVEASSLQINSNGVGLSSISARGAGGAHTPVLWNGFNLQNIMSAGVDVSQLPTSFFENVSIQLGGSSALFGSGAIGGAVHLSNGAKFNQPFNLEIGSYVGSFGSFIENLKFTYGNSFYATSVKMFYNEAKNNFPYKGTYPTDTAIYSISGKQINAEAKQIGLMWNNYFRITTNQSFNVNFWLQNSDQNIAPTLNNILENKLVSSNQTDKAIRGSAEYVINLNKISIWARTGLFGSLLDYTYGSYNSSDTSFSSISEIEATYTPIANLKINGGANYTYEKAISSNYPDSTTRNRYALFSSIRVNNDNSEASLNARVENVNGVFIPITFSFGIQQFYFDNFCQLHANVSKNYRLPTFNDLYYAFSGNPDLKPENGVSYEGGLNLHSGLNSGKLIFSSTFSHSDMSNWINWSSGKDGFWYPSNVDKIKIEVLENSLEFKTKYRDLNVCVKGMHTFTDAVNVNTSEYLAYVPKNKFFGSFTINNNLLTIQYQQSFQSKVNFEDMNSINSTRRSLPSIWLSNIAASYIFNFNSVKLTMNLQVNNILNKDYMSISTYPMPRRNFIAGVRIMF